MRRSIDEELEAEWKRQDDLIAKYPEIYGVMRTQVIFARGNIRPKDEFVIPMLEAVDKFISQEVLKGQIQEVKDMYSWAGDNFVPRSRLRLRLSELKDLLKKEEL